MVYDVTDLYKINGNYKVYRYGDNDNNITNYNMLLVI